MRPWFSHFPLAFQALGAGLIVGTVAWRGLDLYLSNQFRRLAGSELRKELGRELRAVRGQFNNYRGNFNSLAKLIAVHENTVRYLCGLSAPSPVRAGSAQLGLSMAPDLSMADIVRHRRRPAWVPSPGLWRTVLPSHFLLLDADAQLLESYAVGRSVLSPNLVSQIPFLSLRGAGQVIATNIDDKPMFLTVAPVFSSEGRACGRLMLVRELNNHWMQTVYPQPSQDALVVVVLTGHPVRVLAANSPGLDLSGVLQTELEKEYQIAGKDFEDYGSSEIFLNLAVLLPRKRARAFADRLLEAERFQRSILAVILIAVLLASSLILVSRVRRLTAWVTRFARDKLDYNLSSPSYGDELIMLNETVSRLAIAGLEESEKRFRSLAEASQSGIWQIAPNGRTLYANPAMCQMLEVEGPHELEGDEIHSFCVEYGQQTTFPDDSVPGKIGPISFEFDIVGRKGTSRHILLTRIPILSQGGEIQSILETATDISSRKLMEKALRRQAEFDGLTGLPNRLLFRDRLQQALLLSERTRIPGALMFIDLDRFKWVNDTFSHEAGDQLLIQAAERLRACVRRMDTVARLGGDEFTVVIQNVPTESVVEIIARKINHTLAKPFTVADQKICVSGSIGITVFPDDSDEMEQLLKNADSAMYKAKEAGRNAFRFFTAEMNADAEARRRLEQELREALEQDAFCLHYQPRVELEQGRVIGVEALVRWNRAGEGMVFPESFIPLVEEIGLIIPLGRWVLKTACRQNRAWHDAGFDDLRISVNISQKQFSNNAELLGTVIDCLAETGLAPEHLELEITESTVMDNIDIGLETLKDLRSLGVHVSVDDFGTGYSSLGFLKRFPIQTLKIDKSFVRDLTLDSDDAAIVAAIISMAHKLSLSVVAEGVETEEQLAILAKDGCHEIQGYYFSRPLPPEQITQLLENRTTLQLTTLSPRDSRIAAPDRV